MKIQCVEDKCTRCMLCIKDCVSAVWQQSDSGYPDAANLENCTLCSHCLAICPTDAIVHSGLDEGQIRKIKKDRICPDDYETIVRGKRSIRHFKEKPVLDNEIEKIISLSRYTPTATNSQNVSYTVVTDKGILKKVSRKIFGYGVKTFRFTQKNPGRLVYKMLQSFSWSNMITRYLDPMPYYIEETEKGRDLILHNAPALILVHGPKGGSFSNENCNLAACNMMNYAYSLGLGTCYIGFLSLSLKYSKSLRRLLEIPKKRCVYACFVLGYSAVKHKNSVSRNRPDIKWM